MKNYTRTEVQQHNSSNSLWFIIHGKVYDVTQFHIEHPGGAEAHLNVAGQDATECFEAVGHSEEAKSLMASFRIGDIMDKINFSDRSRRSNGEIYSMVEKPDSQEEELNPRPINKSILDNWTVWWLIAIAVVIVANISAQFLLFSNEN